LNRSKPRTRGPRPRRNAPSSTPTRWLQLSRRFPDESALESEALYILPIDLISAIEEHIPGFLSREELEFERALAAIEDVGFFRQRPISFRLVPWAGRLGVGDPDLQRRVDRSSVNVDRMLSEELSLAGLNELQIEQIARRRAEVRLQVQSSQQGYLAWLVTDGVFRGELDQLRQNWDQEHARSAELPRLPLEILGQRRTRPEPEQGDSEARAIRLLWKWGLERLESWDLPVPQSPALTGPNLYSVTDQECSGVVLFVPWYFLVKRDMGLEALIDQRRTERPQRHLESWIRGRETTRFGVGRFGLMWQLYVLIELVLRRRYSDRLRGNLGRLDLAIAAFLCPPADRGEWVRITKFAENIRRVRLAMNDRLRSIERPTN
jgi:hypothetical protein